MQPAVGVDAHRTLARLFPDLDVSVFDEVAALKHSLLMKELHRRTTKGAGR